MNRAKIDRRIYTEERREGLLGLWLINTLQKDKRKLRRQSDCERYVAGLVFAPKGQ